MRAYLRLGRCGPQVSDALIRLRRQCVAQLNHPSTFIGKAADFGAQESIDLPGIPFGVHTTLGYSENSSQTGGILSVNDGTHIVKLALPGNYMATSFVTAADGHDGTLITEATQTANQLVPLTTPHTG
jgi:hypothetical protein